MEKGFHFQDMSNLFHGGHCLRLELQDERRQRIHESWRDWWRSNLWYSRRYPLPHFCPLSRRQPVCFGRTVIVVRVSRNFDLDLPQQPGRNLSLRAISRSNKNRRFISCTKAIKKRTEKKSLWTQQNKKRKKEKYQEERPKERERRKIKKTKKSRLAKKKI